MRYCESSAETAESASWRRGSRVRHEWSQERVRAEAPPPEVVCAFWRERAASGERASVDNGQISPWSVKLYLLTRALHHSLSLSRSKRGAPRRSHTTKSTRFTWPVKSWASHPIERALSPNHSERHHTNTRMTRSNPARQIGHPDPACNAATRPESLLQRLQRARCPHGTNA